MSRLLKEKMTGEVEGFLRDREAVLFLGFTGLKAVDNVEIRRALREQDVTLRIVKNSVAARFFESSEVDIDASLKGPTAVVVGGGDAVELSKALADVGKKHRAIQIKGGVLDGKPISREQVVDLSKLPSRDVLLAQVLAGFQAPVSGLVNALNGIVTGFVRVLSQIRDQKE